MLSPAVNVLASSRAGSLPQLTEFFQRSAVECGSEPARDGVRPANLNPERNDPPLSLVDAPHAIFLS